MPHPLLNKLPKSRKKTDSDSSSSSSYTNSVLLHSSSTQTTTSSSSCFDLKPHSFSLQNQNQNPTSPNRFSNLRSSSSWLRSKLKRCWCSPLFMATQGDVSVRVPYSVRQRKKTFGGQQKIKEDLEKEVSVLHQMLDQEEKVHKILEGAIHRSDGSQLQIPNYLPPKMKELLAELAMVEEEITRLEKEISHLQNGLSNENKESKDSKSKQWQHGVNENLSAPPNAKQTVQGMHKSVPFDPKALYFISKAIKGDNTGTGFLSNEKEDSGGDARQKVSTKSGIQKPPSPMLPPRHSTSTTKLVEPGMGISFDFSSRSTLTSNPSLEESNYRSHPNKLSESIMKCLVFIFVRLMRTSRAHELEKSSTISRSSHSSLSSGRFRVDLAINSKANLSLQRETKQQDPYGIFDNEDSVPRDIGPYKNLVRFTSSSMDQKFLNSSSSIPLLRKLRVLLNNLQNVDLRFLSYQQRLAFWINMYNASIMHGFLQNGVPSGPESLLDLMNKATLQIGGNKISALTIERHILRQQSSSNFINVDSKGEDYDKEVTTHGLYRLETREPNVPFGLCFGTRSSPAVRIYTATGVSSELEKSKLDYLQASIMVTNTKRLVIPELLFQNMHNFAHDADSLLQWVCHQLPTSWSLRKLIVECFRVHTNGKVLNIVDKMPYDFEFQYLLAA